MDSVMNNGFKGLNEQGSTTQDTMDKDDKNKDTSSKDDISDKDTKPKKKEEEIKGGEPSNKEALKREVKIEGTLSEVYTNALMDVFNKKDGITEFQLVEGKELDNKTKKDVEKGKLASESQSQNVVDFANQYFDRDQNYFNTDDNEDVDRDFIYSYIGKNSDINDSDSAIDAINRILKNYNTSNESLNVIAFESDREVSKWNLYLEEELMKMKLDVVYGNKDQILNYVQSRF